MRALKELEDGREEHVMAQVDLLLFDTRNSDILKERMRAQHGSRWYPATFSLSSGEKEDLPSSFGVSQLLLDVSISIRASAGTLSCFFFCLTSCSYLLLIQVISREQQKDQVQSNP
ncbi:hypothetical protein FQA47_008842 [Oryzias melastigma]|uniref:Uncharacterized protein n=1 Tax=Oryzias melastigma TaxID=30732 RepID=A0A834EX44_ORYME|nr:hypothetical protein FQA47_008842 [Oryzias melastigma]